MTAFNKIKFVSAVIAVTIGSISGAQAGSASAYTANGTMYCYNQSNGSVRHFGPCTSLYRTCDAFGCNLQRKFW